MKVFGTVALALAAAALGSGCTDPRTSMLDSIVSYDNQFSDDEKTIFATFSGGGMRAAALSYGVLKELKAQQLKNEDGSSNEEDNRRRLIDKVDLVSSVSGGSVTAAYWALKGSGGFEDLESKFLKQGIQTPMLAKGILTLPWTLLGGLGYHRIELLIEHLDNEELFGDFTYDKLIHADRNKRPNLIINATDMETGYIFPFIQAQFDLICADPAKMRLADAVAASAACPVLLSALSLKNYSPCPAQKRWAEKGERGWNFDHGHARPDWVTKYLNSPYDKHPREVLHARRALDFIGSNG